MKLSQEKLDIVAHKNLEMAL